jgi:hypothetical protein
VPVSQDPRISRAAITGSAAIGGPGQFAAAAERLALFRIDPIEDGQPGAAQHAG